MKLMKLRFSNYLGLMAMTLAGGSLSTSAEEPARSRGTPIIFSEPKSDSVSSNLNQLDVKTSPFRGLESDLKKPFEIFDAGKSAGSFASPSFRMAPPAAPANSRRIQDLIDKRAEMMLPGPDSGDTDLVGDDLFKKGEDKRDAAGKRLTTPLDRYYDRLDRERAALTNQLRNTDLFGADKNEKNTDGKDAFGRAAESPFDTDAKDPLRSSGRLSDRATGRDGFFSDSPKPKTFDDLLNARSSEPAPRSSVVKETRLELFKRLLDRPAYTPSATSYSPSLPEAGIDQRPVTTSPAPTWSSPSSSAKTVNPRDSFTSRAGLVGAPPTLPSLPDFSDPSSSLNTPPPPAPKRPPSTFAIPKRQF